ncbi:MULTISPECIES: winged helix-turn-helix domain-containing protein [Bradyrhizobium]|uniref:winged helix-turn-helix domain-containing protein n=1 Tax=Bradyrhizobium TaxID=374 RepID=UPI00040B7A06|nr:MULTISPECIES: winged helix-turn-helix domain-containing protein [Bradyrhizobium]QOG20250.1 adenylate cyclase [Bradyrhizobium sp. SEMIA]UFW52582.1 winged helix-turn-helix domain-containing protein [Bradyrhizobium arachidis]
MRYLFEDCTFDTGRRELRRGTELVSVTPQLFDLLEFLICNRDRVVSKDELVATVWNGRIVSDAALTTRLNAARSAIGDSGQKQSLIKTLPRKGFRFVGAVREMSEIELTGSAPRTSPAHLSIVVLPFANLSADPEQDYLVDGITESLTTDLSRIRRSFVIGRHTAFTYKGKVLDLRQIGRELNVRYVVEGSVQRAGNRLRVNVKLVNAEDSSQLWSDRFDKAVADLFDLQDEIVSRLANTLNAQLIEAEARRAESVPHPDSMDFYLQGRFWWNKGLTSENLRPARHFFERALSVDPGNVDAMVWMATVDTLTACAMLTDDSHSLLVAAETTLLKALSVAPNHSWAHVTLGAVLVYTNRIAEGVAECERALALDRNLAVAHPVIGIAKLFTGCGKETEGHVNQALRLSPHDIFAFAWMGDIAFAKMQLEADAEAVTWFHRSIETNRNYAFARFGLGSALAHLGRLPEAQAAVRAGLALNPTFTIRRFKSFSVSDNPAFLAGAKRILKGLHLAGVPEG